MFNLIEICLILFAVQNFTKFQRLFIFKSKNWVLIGDLTTDGFNK